MNKIYNSFNKKFKEKKIKITDKVSIQKSLIDVNKTYEQNLGYKPHGLWYSLANLDNNSWISFCIENEMYNKIDLNKNYLYKFNISKKYYTIFNNKTILPVLDFSIIRIRNFKDLNFFTEKYSIIVDKYLVINWIKVKEDGWSGIEFSPFFSLYTKVNYKNREKNSRFLMKYSWYSSVDVSSGCIWNTDLIKKIKISLI